MGKPGKNKKTGSASRPNALAEPVYSVEAQELRALLRRVPDGFQATLKALAARPAPDRERVMGELARGMGKEILPLFRAAALGAHEELARTTWKVLPLFGTRAAGDVLAEAYQARPDGEWASLAWSSAVALQARGIHVAVPELETDRDEVRYTLRETSVSVPDGVGSRTVAARMQDQYGVWHAVIVLWNDQVGVKDGFVRPFSRQEWEERTQRMHQRGVHQVTCPVDYARWDVQRARELNERSGLPLGEFLTEWDRLVGPPPEGYTPPDPLEAARAADADQRAAALAESAALFRVAGVLRWSLEPTDCVSSARRWMDLQHRIRLRGSEASHADELRALLRDAVEELIDAPTAELYRRRLVDLSRVAEWDRQETAARQAAATAIALEEGAAPADLPFFTGLVERSLLATAEILRRGEDPEKLAYRPMRRRQS